jgi:hypothetical protein
LQSARLSPQASALLRYSQLPRMRRLTLAAWVKPYQCTKGTMVNVGCSPAKFEINAFVSDPTGAPGMPFSPNSPPLAQILPPNTRELQNRGETLNPTCCDNNLLTAQPPTTPTRDTPPPTFTQPRMPLPAEDAPAAPQAGASSSRECRCRMRTRELATVGEWNPMRTDSVQAIPALPAPPCLASTRRGTCTGSGLWLPRPT